jgi:hypothetical protein
MEEERLGRVVAVTLSAQLSPGACAAFGVAEPEASGLPPPLGSATPAVRLNGGEEAPTGVPLANQPCGEPGFGRHRGATRQDMRTRVRVSEIALGPATSTPEVTPVALRYLRTR